MNRACLFLTMVASIWWVACGEDTEVDIEAEATARPVAKALESSAELSFVEVSAASGVDWVHNNGAFGQRWLPETLGPGVLLLDADGDQRLDIFFVNGSKFPGQIGEATHSALYLNQGGMRFIQATDAGLGFSAYCLGGSAADYDNDGDTDVFLSCLGQDKLLQNEGGVFVDVSQSAGLTEEYALGASSVFFDADRDGHLDLFVTRYVEWTPEIDTFCSIDGKVKSYCTPSVYDSLPSRYYHNQGDGSFEDKTVEAGLDIPAKALGVVAIDAENDGWPDLVVACDTHRNLLFHNRGDGTFEEVGILSGISVSLDGGVRGGMGIAAGDFDRSGRSSVAITYFAYELNGLYRNEGNIFFLDVAPNTEFGRNSLLNLGWSCLFFDFDLDGWLDFFVANGDLDSEREKILSNASHAQQQQLFRNRGDGTFREVTATTGGDLAQPMVGRGAGWGDLDDDGDLDLVVTSNGGPAKIFENRGTGYGNWLRLSLEGGASNRDALGARVTLTTGGESQTRYLRSGGGYLSQSQVDPVFGLGTAELIDEIVVYWPSGAETRRQDVDVNQRLSLFEDDAEETP